jgi:hypothetical protein
MERATRSAIPVRVIDVLIDGGQSADELIRYQIMLSCGCHWCEERTRAEIAPTVGAIAYCASNHPGSNLFKPSAPGSTFRHRVTT